MTAPELKWKPADKMALLEELLEQLDALDEVDFFGPEGWRHFLQLGDGE